MYTNVPESCVADDPAGSLTARTMLRDVERHAILVLLTGSRFPPVYLGIPVMILYTTLQL